MFYTLTSAFAKEQKPKNFYECMEYYSQSEQKS